MRKNWAVIMNGAPENEMLNLLSLQLLGPKAQGGVSKIRRRKGRVKKLGRQGCRSQTMKRRNRTTIVRVSNIRNSLKIRVIYIWNKISSWLLDHPLPLYESAAAVTSHTCTYAGNYCQGRMSSGNEELAAEMQSLVENY